LLTLGTRAGVSTGLGIAPRLGEVWYVVLVGGFGGDSERGGGRIIECHSVFPVEGAGEEVIVGYELDAI